MKLLLDIGNSQIKWAWLEGAAPGVTRSEAYKRNELPDWCDRCLRPLPRPTAVWIANVAGPEAAGHVTRWCQRQWHMSPIFVQTAHRYGGVINGYADISEMGVDRWLAMVAAHQRYPQALYVISCGTALTLDALTAKGEHLGGLILPGPALMREALSRGTQGVRVDGDWPLQLELGRSTRTGVTAGTAYAIVGLIERASAQLQQTDPDIRGIITGGAADSVAALCRLSLEPVPNLVLHGLAYYALQQ